MAKSKDGGEKSEKPTPKRRREARKQGQVARSQDLAGWCSLLAITAILPAIVRSGGQRLSGLFTQAASVMANPSQGGALKVFGAGMSDVVALVFPLIGLAGAVALFVSVGQVGLVFASEAAKPSFHRLNPWKGFKKLFSVNSLWELAKQALRLVLLVIIAYRVLSGVARAVAPSQPVALAPMFSYAASSIIGLVRDVALVGLVLSIGDYAYQRFRRNKSLKMSKFEIKEEARRSEGDPVTKGQIRKRQYSLSRMRMMAAVAGADVVITNPTHFAVALRYEPGRGRAPHVVAKGAGEVALKIREEALRHKVPVVEDPPLARALHAACDLGTAVPKELYVAVARLLAFVMTLPDMVRRSGIVQRRATSALVA